MIRVGLVGFGMAGRVFHAPLISSVEGLELAAVLERNSDNAAERYPGITTYCSLETMLADASLGLFVVATPNGTHFEIARQILEAGKSVVVDKPTAVTSSEIAQLMALASAQGVHLIPFHNRRWDSDFQTLYKLVREDLVGRIVHLESTFDRWRPIPRARAWKEDPAEGGMLLDIGTHLADQAMGLFGRPAAVSADVIRERDGDGSNDSFTVRLRYAEFAVTLSANALSSLPRPRFHLRGVKGNYWKWGLDPQEAALNKITRIADAAWGHEPPQDWGTLNVDVDGGVVSRPVPPIPGDYRRYYAGVRDALLGKSHPPVPALAAWRVARLLEWAAESSEQRRQVACDWSGEPAMARMADL
ncbi:MAG TPA: Gfo/Idh/MocA family oxidoreductase [Terracidiphilus sp.]|nr:Gfo/Idh/MocA family oxidoreductase [Terracidiphilus sp.]